MRRHPLRTLLVTVISAVATLALVLVIETVMARRSPGVPFDDPPRTPQGYGRGRALVYLVLGDSTAVGQGGDYERGVAVSTARHLARSHAVSLTNLAVPGARAEDVLRHQVDPAARLRPDVVLVAVGANDVARLTPPRRVKAHLMRIVDRLLAANCNARIALTASPDLGAAPRIAQPLRWVAGLATSRLNRVFEAIAQERRLTLAPIARETGPLHRKDPTLFAADGFHPNDRGYATWVPVLERALDHALHEQPSHCP